MRFRMENWQEVESFWARLLAAVGLLLRIPGVILIAISK